MKTWLFACLVALIVSTKCAYAISPFPNEMNARFSALENEKTAKIVYDVTSNSSIGATGDYHTGVYLPAGTIITRSFFYVKTLFVGSGTFAAKCEDANNIFTAFTLSSRAANTIIDGTETGTTTTMASSIAAPCEVILTVASSTITAGKGTLYFRYLKP